MAGGPQASSVWFPQDFENVYILIKIIIAYNFLKKSRFWLLSKIARSDDKEPALLSCTMYWVITVQHCFKHVTPINLFNPCTDMMHRGYYHLHLYRHGD